MLAERIADLRGSRHGRLGAARQILRLLLQHRANLGHLRRDRIACSIKPAELLREAVMELRDLVQRVGSPFSHILDVLAKRIADTGERGARLCRNAGKAVRLLIEGFARTPHLCRRLLGHRLEIAGLAAQTLQPRLPWSLPDRPSW